MPEISRFFGIVIAMSYNDHAPPHFHARYGNHKAIFAIHDMRLLAGSLPPRVLGLVMEWAAIHRAELVENWQQAENDAPLRRIEPLT